MKRFRLVSQQNNSPGIHVSTVVIGENEVDEQLDLEASMHAMAGWTVTRGERTVVCRRSKTTRVITVRESSPMDDSLPEGEPSGFERSGS